MDRQKITQERCLVTILAVDTVNSTRLIEGLDPDDAEELIDTILSHVRSCIENAGGILANFAGDGGIAVFGWPVASEDHAERACIAAWNIQNPARGSQLLDDAHHEAVRFRVGIHSGLVGFRNLSFQTGSMLDLVGGNAHLAAQVEKQARPGEILLSSATAQLFRRPVEMEALPPADGVVNRLELQRLLAQPLLAGNGGLRDFASPMVGRTRELAALSRLLGAREASGKVAGIIGEPGIGKSRLVSEFVSRIAARANPWASHVHTADPQRASTAFHAVRGLLLSLLGLDASARNGEAVFALAVHGVPVASQELALSILSLPGHVEIPRAGGQSLSSLFKPCAELLVGLAPQRCALIVEDIHHVDQESLKSLAALVSAMDGKQLLLVVTGRPEAAQEAMTLTHSVISLEGLPGKAMRDLVQASGPGRELPRAAIEQVLVRADGNPFVLEQLVASIGRNGSDPLNTIPQSVESLIHARLNQLSPLAKKCAQTLSVLGTDAELPLLQRTTDIGSADLVKALSELASHAFINSAASRSIRFRHAILAEACAETVHKKQRMAIHAGAVGVISDLYPDLTLQHERLAHHCAAAGNPGQAVEHLWRAALGAQRKGAHWSLLSIFERAMRLLEHDLPTANERHSDFVALAFASLVQIGEFARMRQYLPRALEIARKSGDRKKLCALNANMAMNAWFEGRYDEGLPQARKAYAMAQQLDSISLQFASGQMLANLLHGRGDLGEAIAIQRELCSMLSGPLETARLGAAGIPCAIAHGFLSWFLVDDGKYDDGLVHAMRSLDIANTTRDPYSQVLARNALGRNLIVMDRNGEAAEMLQGAVDITRANGFDAPKPHLAGLMGTATARIGEAHRALPLIEDCFESGLHLRTGRLEMSILMMGYAEALAASGKLEQAMPAVDQAYEIAATIGNPGLMIQALELRAALRRMVDRHSPLIDMDLAESDALSARHGYVAKRL
ncbi:MAG: AAA family ATPase [Rhizobiaceae bacterium]